MNCLSWVSLRTFFFGEPVGRSLEAPWTQADLPCLYVPSTNSQPCRNFSRISGALLLRRYALRARLHQRSFVLKNLFTRPSKTKKKETKRDGRVESMATKEKLQAGRKRRSGGRARSKQNPELKIWPGTKQLVTWSLLTRDCALRTCKYPPPPSP